MTRHSHVAGLELLQRALGAKLQNVRRHVFRLPESRDDLGHGITELFLNDQVLAIGIGPNDAGIVIGEGPLGAANLDPRDWTEVKEDRALRWRTYRGRRLHYVDLFGADGSDMALVFHLEGHLRFSIVLCDRCLRFARDLEPFVQRRSDMPRFVDRLL